jgi:CBS domain-containing protein
VAHALDLMDEFRTDVLPVVSGGRLLGMLKESAILENNRPEATVAKLMDEVGVPYVRDRQHFYDVLKLMGERKLALVPVLDMNGRYLGVVSGPDALQRMSTLVSAGGPGSVLVLEMASNDYSLQQIARIVEDEGARILSVFCTDLPDSMRMEVTLKVNRDDVRAILQAFDRFEYTVRTTYQGPHAEDDLRARYEDLMRIINM